MTSQTIPSGSTSTTFDNLAKGSYTVKAEAGKYATINQSFEITQADIEEGTKTVNLGQMEFGTHTFNVSITGYNGQVFTVDLYDKTDYDEEGNTAEVLQTKQTVNGAASFTVEATENGVNAYNYMIVVHKDGYRTVNQSLDATVAEFRLNGSESVPLSVGSNVVTLTVIVEAETSVEVTVE